MKFNPDCIRDILFECERVIDTDNELYIEETDIPNSLSKYSWSELLYHLKQCKMSGLFDEKSFEDITGAYKVTDLSPKGHDLLAKIRDDKVWKKIIKKGIQTLPQLLELVTKVISVRQLFDGNNLGN